MSSAQSSVGEEVVGDITELWTLGMQTSEEPPPDAPTVDIDFG